MIVQLVVTHGMMIIQLVVTPGMMIVQLVTTGVIISREITTGVTIVPSSNDRRYNNNLVSSDHQRPKL